MQKKVTWAKSNNHRRPPESNIARRYGMQSTYRKLEGPTPVEWNLTFFSEYACAVYRKTESLTAVRTGLKNTILTPQVTCYIHLRIHHMLRILFLFRSYSDFVVYEVTTLIFPKNQRQCASFSLNVVILFLSFKSATTAPNKLIDSQHYKRYRRKIPIALHSLLHFTLTTTQLNLSLLKTLNYFKTIQRQVLSFRDLHQFHSKATKTLAIFWSEVHYKLMTNLKFSNALAHDAKPVLPAPPSPLSRPRSPEWRCIACSGTSFQSVRLIHFLRLPV